MLLALGLVLAAKTATVQPVLVDGMLAHPTRVLVKYQNEASLDQLRRSAPVIKVMPEIRWAVVSAQPGQLQKTKSRLGQLSGVEKATYDRAAKPAYDPNDPLFADSWNLQALKVNLAWDSTRGDQSVIVAVIDTGVMVDHPDLQANIWTNAGEIPGNGIDDDGNGYIDDIHGYDFPYNDGDPNDVHGHGTACAGIVAAVQDNGIGLSGVAPRCRVMALKAAQDDGYFFDSNDAAAYIYAVNNGAKVLSCSFYSDRVSQMERDAIDYAYNNGALPVVAAGNDSSVIPYYPAGYEKSLAVAALNTNLNKAGFSNYGSWVDVSAPGVNLPATTNSGGYTTGFAGTSGACPQIAGVAALCYSVKQNATPSEVRNAIEDTAIGQSQAPFGEFANYGRVDAQAAVARILSGSGAERTPVVRWSNLALGTTISRTGSRYGARIYGRGFGGNNTVVIRAGSFELPIIRRTRDLVEFSPYGMSTTLDVFVNGSLVQHIDLPTVNEVGYPLTEASSPSATVTGGFFETLKTDGTILSCTRRSDGLIRMQGTFRKVLTNGSYNLTIRRRYTGTTVGTETLYMYDWSSASYPYGSWVPVGSVAVPTSMTTTSFAVPTAARFVDPEGTAYFLLQTTDDLPSGAKVEIDQLLLQR